jgi:hypothetical protein
MLHGDPGAFAAVNDIAMFGTHTNDSLENLNRPQPHIDQAAVRFGGESVLVSVGLHDLASFLPDGSGIGGEPLSGEGMHGFLSTHFSRQLALPFLELERSLSIPAVLVRWRITTALVLKGGLTFGDVGYHVFIRNSLPLELEFRHRVFGREGRLAVYLGGADADASGTHRISPAGGLAVSQHLSGGLAVFASYCRAEAANPVSVLFGSFRWHGKAGVVAGDLSTDGNGWRAGVGFSAARHYTAPVPEKAVEVFWRLPLGPGMHLTPNLLLLVNPAGIEESGRTLALLAGLRYVLSY